MKYRTPALALVLSFSMKPAVAGMIDKEGMAPWEVCGMCHGLDGNSHMSKFPKLAGQKAPYIINQFTAFHDGRRSNDGGQMQAITEEVAPGDINQIARHFANQMPVAPSTDDIDTARYEQGKTLFNTGRKGLAACNSCHHAERDDVPWLDGQHEDYLNKQLNDFRQGERLNDAGAVMQQIASELSTQEQEALVHYLSRVSYRTK